MRSGFLERRGGVIVVNQGLDLLFLTRVSGQPADAVDLVLGELPWYDLRIHMVWQSIKVHRRKHVSALSSFVPDSPTASLFFTWFLLILLLRRANDKDTGRKPSGGLRSFVEAFAVITSFKYGIWAVA